MKLTVTINLNDEDHTAINDVDTEVFDPTDIWDAVLEVLSTRDIEPERVTSYVIVAVPD